MLQNRVNKPKFKANAKTILDNRVPGIVSQNPMEIPMGELPDLGPNQGQLDPSLEYDPSIGFRKKQNLGGSGPMPPGKAEMGPEKVSELFHVWEGMSPEEQAQYEDFVGFLTAMEEGL
jgi:hypothetical protein